MNALDRQMLLDSLADQLASLVENKFYYPSRVKYLDAILDHIKKLDRRRRYIVFALNSSVAAQRLLGTGGYDFRGYLRAFRERSILGDYVVRVYCLSDNSKISLGNQLTDLRAVVAENSLQGCLNLYRTSGEGFNCAYFIPLIDGAETDELDEIYKLAVSGSAPSVQELLGKLRDVADLSAATLFLEHHDYDILNARGCGFRYEPNGVSAEVRDKIATYTHIATGSLHLATRDRSNPQFISYRVAVIVALPIEFDAVRGQLDVGSVILINDGSGVSFYHGTTTIGDDCISIIIAQLPTTGSISSALATALLIERYAVSDIFLVGIAGGLRGEVHLGDVVVGSTVVYAEKKKISFDDERPDYRIYEARFSELSTTHNRDRYKMRMTKRSPNGDPDSTSAHFGCALLCVEKVITDPQWLTVVKRRVQRKLVAVENEATGVYFTASQIHPSKTRYITIKGISDFADSEKDDSWHEYAADAAAAYVIDAVHHLQRG